MPVLDTYSRRKRRAERGEPDLYQYDHVPDHLRMQIRYILDDALGPLYVGRSSLSSVNKVWRFITEALCREKGVAYLFDEHTDFKTDCIGAILHEKNIDDWLNIIELCFAYVLRMKSLTESARQHYHGAHQDPDEAIEELNFRFREAGLGYRFESGQIIRVDSQFVHAEVVKPALSLLTDPRFAGAQEEFLSAHAHHRAGEHEDAIVDANRAFESTIKAICDVKGKGWEYPKGARASDLVKIIRKNGLLPDYLDASFDQLIATLTSGLPRVRNNAGGHGQGATPRETPDYVAGYALHLAAANIVLLVEALKETERQ